MGSPKQLLQLGGESLVRRAAATALASRCAAVFAVVGAHAAAVAAELDGLAVTVVRNARWEDGLSSSIRVGIEALSAVHPRFDGALLILADQPAVTAALLDRLLAAGESAASGLAACEYAGTVGVPALFARRHFEALCNLRGDRGGKALLAAHGDAVARIPFAPAAIDLDSRDDYERALHEE